MAIVALTYLGQGMMRCDQTCLFVALPDYTAAVLVICLTCRDAFYHSCHHTLPLQTPLTTLRPRERAVWDLMVAGHTRHEISVILDLAPVTIKQYARVIRKKLQLQTNSYYQQFPLVTYGDLERRVS